MVKFDAAAFLLFVRFLILFWGPFQVDASRFGTWSSKILRENV